MYETFKVRHGLMLVGNSMTGKSVVMQVLQEALTLEFQDQNKNLKVIMQKINPKSIQIHQLYGMLDTETKSWVDGIFPKIMRDIAINSQQVQNPNLSWVTFDGPVDPEWIENLNTLLDENKKLCLSSGEIIKLTAQTTIIFETKDLQFASPATISRCGMIYLDNQNTDWRPIMQIFFNEYWGTIFINYQSVGSMLSFKCFEAALEFIKQYCQFPLEYSDLQLVQSFINIVKYALIPYETQEVKILKDFDEFLQNLIVFAIVWSIGAILEENSRSKFHLFIISMVSGKNLAQEYNLNLPYEPAKMMVRISESIPVYEIFYERKGRQWINWTQTQNVYKLESVDSMNQLIIPTIDSIRNNYLLTVYIEMKKHYLQVGPTGTGKTINIASTLNAKYYNEQYSNLITAYSGQTTVNLVQKSIEAKMSTKRRKGRFGPEDRKERMIIFIDDFNMPNKQTWDAQPPLEILRQQMDQGGWFDLDNKEYKYLEDITFVAAMGPPSQGRNKIDLRISRHFNILYVEPYSANSMKIIFNSMMDWYFLNVGNQMSKNIQALKEKIVSSTIELYNQVKQSKELFPIPTKSHYQFNIRDLTKVFYGLAQVTHISIKNENDYLRLWTHECFRIFQDRLIIEQDEEFFQKLLKQILKENFNKDWKHLVKTSQIIFSHIVPNIYPGDDKNEPPLENIYCELTDLSVIQTQFKTQIAQYNEVNPKSPLHIVLFETAIFHVLRIIRIIMNPLGHCLLIGVGGSGRKSLTHFATYLAQKQIVQIDSKNWVEDLQKLLKIIGLECKPVALFFSDSQQVQEFMFEDISNLLNNGEIPNLFPVEEKAKIVEEISNMMPNGTVIQKYQCFISNCKDYLRIILSMSPVGENFRKRIRNYPGIVNCTTIDWFKSWPYEALYSTAYNYMQPMTLSLNEDQNAKSKVEVSNCFVNINISIIQANNKYYQEHRRFNYITPSSYLDHIQTFIQLMGIQDEEKNKLISKYHSGLKKLNETEKAVQIMQATLEKLAPILEEKNLQNSKMLENLQVNQDEANIKKQQCEQDEQLTNIKKEEALELSQYCEAELAKVIPILDEAARSLEKVKQEDITLIKSFSSPPITLDYLMQTICLCLLEDQNVPLKNIDPNDPSKGQKQDYWEYSKKYILNNKLIRRVQSYKEEQIKSFPPKQIEKIRQMMTKPELERKKVQNVSEPAANIAGWIRAMIDTYDALLVVEPKRKSLREAEYKLQLQILDLQQKQDSLKKVILLLQALEDEYNKAQDEKRILEDQYNDCNTQLKRAKILIIGLDGEKKNWGKKALKYQDELDKIIGDVMICSAFISYLGPFIVSYRESLQKTWEDILREKNFQISDKITLQGSLSNDLQIGEWVSKQKLPNDRFSIQNAVINQFSSRYCLFIDPQFQANMWVKEMAGKDNLITLNPYSLMIDVIYEIEKAITQGLVILLENIQETIDPIYDEILNVKLMKFGKYKQISLGEKLLDYNPNFRFYISTKFSNPHFQPEICIKINLINFIVSPDGLEDQILDIIIYLEEPQKHQEKIQNIQDFFLNLNKQQQTENNILQTLNESKGNILEDEVLIDMLQKSQKESQEINEKMIQLEQNRIQFNTLQKFYTECVRRISNLYFCINDLSNIENVYQFSLEYYISIFEKSVETAPQGKFDRVKNINNEFTRKLFENISMSLFEKDKLKFSLLMCIRILQHEQKKINSQEVRFLAIGMLNGNQTMSNPGQGWLTDKQWNQIQDISQNLPVFKNFDVEFIESLKQWKKIIDHPTPHIASAAGWPIKWQNALNPFQKVLVIRILRYDKLISAIRLLISDCMNPSYIQFPSLDINKAYEESNFNKPLLFVLQSGIDPRQEVEKLAGIRDMTKNLFIKSLGQGQSEIIIKILNEALIKGKWVLLQNCHLSASFMNDLEHYINSIELKTNYDLNFRIFLSTQPFKQLPVSLLQKSVKITYEMPKGIKNSLIRSFATVDPNIFETCKQPTAWKNLLFGLVFFHALVLERRKFGPLGWNIPYSFSTDDLSISIKQLRMFLDEYDNVQWPALNYMISESNYGGKVTDPSDSILIKIILKRFYNPIALQSEYKYSKSGVYFCPIESHYQSYVDYINSLPLNDSPEIYGLHDNAEISASIIESNNITNTVLNILPRIFNQEGVSQDEIVKNKCQFILDNLPKLFDEKLVFQNYPVDYDQCMNTYNILISILYSTIQDLVKAIEGIIVMSNQLDEIYYNLFDNNVPQLWKDKAYPCLKPLASWIQSLKARTQFIQKWIDDGEPVTFWITAIFQTQSFFTATLQNYARKTKIPIDTLNFTHKCIAKQYQEQLQKKPEFGCYIYGLYLDGCRWDDELEVICDQRPNTLFSDMCYVHFIPILESQGNQKQDRNYVCPLYKTSVRKGELKSTGHSTNFILNINIPISSNENSDFWAERGVALISQLDD